jgi:biotin carboxyl carrier protein
MIYEFVYKGETKSVELKDNRIVSFGTDREQIEVEYLPDGRIMMRAGGLTKELHAATNGDKTYVDIDGILFEFGTPSAEINGVGGGGAVLTDPSKVFAPMPGKIVKVMVSVGDAVEPKKHLVILEAMKMENIIVAKAKGTVTAVNCAVGERVDTDTPIIELEVAG